MTKHDPSYLSTTPYELTMLDSLRNVLKDIGTHDDHVWPEVSRHAWSWL